VPYPIACSPQGVGCGSPPADADGWAGLVPARSSGPCGSGDRPCPARSTASNCTLLVADAHVDLLFERVAGRSDSVALTDVMIDGHLDVVLEGSEPGRTRS
jgi:hypothetical protein